MKGIEGLLAGHTLAGRYRIEEVIGRGGFAAVYRASDETLQRTVAVKVIMLSSPDAEHRQRIRARFHREARAAARLQHPNVVTIYDFGTDPDLGLDFLVMELLRGEDLAARIQRQGALPVPDAMRILREAAEGLAAGHRAGLIHRDVKPGNLFLTENDGGTGFRVRVLDFGIAQVVAAEETVTQLTHGGQVLSPAYASPEQLRGDRSLSPATDVFSLGVIGYEALTGARLFGHGSDLRSRYAVPRVRERSPDVPAAVEAVIARAMAIDPEDRYPDAGALAAALVALAEGPPAEPGSDRRVLPPVYQARTRPRLPEEPPSPVPGESRTRSGRSMGVLVALVLIVAAAGMAWWALSGEGDPQPVPPQARVEAEEPDPVPATPAPAVEQAPLPEEEPAETAAPEEIELEETVPAPPSASRGGAPSTWSRNALALHEEGLRLFQGGSYREAAERFQLAVRLEPDNVHFRNNLAWALFRAGRVGEASSELDEVLRRAPRRDIAYANLAEIRLAQGDTTAAIAAYRRFLELNTDPRRESVARRKLAEIGG